MPFCRNCGFEVSNEAYVCTKCGVLINGVQAKQTSENLKKQSELKPDQHQFSGFHRTASFWLLFIASIFIIVSILFFNLSLYMAEVDGIYTLWLFPDYLMSEYAFIISCIALVLTILSYSLSFASLKKGEISKATNYTLLLFMILTVVYTFAKLCMIM